MATKYKINLPSNKCFVTTTILHNIIYLQPSYLKQPLVN